MKLFRNNQKPVQTSDREIYEEVAPIIDAEAVQDEKARVEITRRRCAMLHRSEIIVGS